MKTINKNTKFKHNIAIIPGDGIGPEVILASLKVIKKALKLDNVFIKEKNYEFILLTFILLIGSSMYALLMGNEGTFVRYRFSLFYPFLLAAFYLSSASYKDSKK